MTTETPITEKHLIRMAYIFTGLIIIVMVWHGGVQADRVLEK